MPIANREAFVYCWTDLENNMLYVGYRKGSEEDGYISSSKSFNAAYEKNPSAFSRSIIAHGSKEDMIALESAILRSVNAARSKDFYNLNNNDKTFACFGHTEETKKKMSKTWKSRKSWNIDQKKASESWKGSKHSAETRKKMSEAQQRHSESRKTRMENSNPMKNPDSIAKMLETRRRNKEMKDG